MPSGSVRLKLGGNSPLTHRIAHLLVNITRTCEVINCCVDTPPKVLEDHGGDEGAMEWMLSVEVKIARVPVWSATRV